MDGSRQGLAGTLALIAATVSALFALALTADDETGRGADLARVDTPAAETEPAAKLDPEALLALGLRQTPGVARRVAAIRELSFERVPKPRIADSEDLREIAEQALAKERVRRELEAADAALKLLGLLEPGSDLGEVAADVTGLAAAYYDPREEKLFLVGDSVPAGPALAEFVLAHELTHALEDQVFALPRSVGVSDDRALAESALVEGTATALMQRYAQLHLDPIDLAAEATGVDAGGAELPRFAEAEVTFTYLGGQRFVDALLRAGGDWKLVNFAYQRRLPRSTEQILHPEKYLADERPLALARPSTPGRGWSEIDSGNLGEFATREILRTDAEEIGADAAAAGWGGDTYRLFSRDADDECADLCRSSHALAITWRGDNAREARELARALRAFVPRALGGTERTAGRFSLEGGAAAVTLQGDRVGLGLAPEIGLAARLAG